MTTTNTSKSSTKNTPKTNGSTDHSEQPAAQTSTTPTAPASDKKPVTVIMPEVLHRKVKIAAELSGVSLSDLVEQQLKVVVKERLPGLLSQLGDEP